MDGWEFASSSDCCSLLASVMAEERPITVDEACALRLLLFGNTSDSFKNAWTGQSFRYRSVPAYGFLQKEAGPCGLLAAVQAYVMYELLFGGNHVNHSVDIGKSLALSDKRSALARAMTSILWQAGRNKEAIIAVKRDQIALDASATAVVLKPDGLLEYVYLKYFKCRACLLEYHINFISTMMSDDKPSCILFLYSVIFSHGIQRIKEEMDYPESHLIGEDSYCSQEVINLILIGKAVANLFDGDLELNSGGSETSIHRGVQEQSKIGILSVYEYQETCTVGNNFKTPKFPIWLLLGESHFTVLFSKAQEILKCKNSEETFTLYHYDGLASRYAEQILIIKPLAPTNSPSQDIMLPVTFKCILTK